MLKSGFAGLDDLYKTLSPVLYPWLGMVIWSVSKSIAAAPKLIGLTNVLRVVSSNSIWNDVVIPGVKDTETLSFACKLCDSLHTTVPTTFSTKPVISVFVGFKLWTWPLPKSSKNKRYAVEPIPVIPPVDPIPNALVDIPNKSLLSLIANTGELLVNLKLGTALIPLDTKSGVPSSLEYISLSPVSNPWSCKNIFWVGINLSVLPPPTTRYVKTTVEPIPTPVAVPIATLSVGLK